MCIKKKRNEIRYSDTKGKGVCRCISAEHGDNEMELGHDDILADGLIKKGIKEQTQLEVAIGDGMEFTIHGDMKNNKPKKSKYLNNATVNKTTRRLSSPYQFYLSQPYNSIIEYQYMQTHTQLHTCVCVCVCVCACMFDLLRKQEEELLPMSILIIV